MYTFLVFIVCSIKDFCTQLAMQQPKKQEHSIEQTQPPPETQEVAIPLEPLLMVHSEPLTDRKSTFDYQNKCMSYFFYYR